MFYVVFDVEPDAVDGDTIKVSIANPATDILVSGGIDVLPSNDCIY